MSPDTDTKLVPYGSSLDRIISSMRRWARYITLHYITLHYITSGMRAVVVFVAGQSPQEVQLYLLGSWGEGEARVVVREKGLVVVWLLGSLSTPTDSKIIVIRSLIGILTSFFKNSLGLSYQMDNYHKFNKLISKLILSKTYYWNAGIIWMIVNLGIREWRIQGIESILILKLFQNERVYYFLFYRGFYLLSTMAFHTSPLWLIGIPALISLFMSRVTVNWTGFFRFTTTVFQRDSTWVINHLYSDNFQYVIILYSDHFI